MGFYSMLNVVALGSLKETHLLNSAETQKSGSPMISLF